MTMSNKKYFLLHFLQLFVLFIFFKKMGNSLVVKSATVRMAHLESKDISKVLSQYMNGTKKLALLLDYDGTLTPIVSHPDLAIIPQETQKLLKRLSTIESLFLAIVSGRAVDNVKKLVGLDGIHYAGNHGFEILNPDGSRYIHEIPCEHKQKLKDMITELSETVSDNGAWVEDKIYSITYHFRSVPKDLQKQYEASAKEIMKKSGFRITHAHYGLEAKPPINWNKGTASLKLLENQFSEDWKNLTKVLFVGDDTTDEDAMEALKGNAITFRISEDKNVETSADYVIPNIDYVLDILHWFDAYYCGQ